MDEGETSLQAAIRETEEESGLKEQFDYEITDIDRKYEINYMVRNNKKCVVYWLAKLINPKSDVKLSQEHQDFKWLGIAEAIEFAKYKEMVNVLQQANDFIKAHLHSD